MKIAVLGVSDHHSLDLATHLCQQLVALGAQAKCLQASEDLSASVVWSQITDLPSDCIWICEASALFLNAEPFLRLTNVWAQTFDITLFAGQETLPPSDQGGQHTPTQDSALRAQLNQHQLPYQVVYGSHTQRVRQALAVMAPRLDQAVQTSIQAQALADTEVHPRWLGTCDKCGDASCEHRLFTRLGLIKRTH